VNLLYLTSAFVIFIEVTHYFHYYYYYYYLPIIKTNILNNIEKRFLCQIYECNMMQFKNIYSIKWKLLSLYNYNKIK